MTSQEMKIAMISLVLVALAIFTEGKPLPRYRRGTNDVRHSYIVHYNSKGEPLRVAGFEDFVRDFNRQRGANASPFAASYPSGEKFEYSSPFGASETAAGSLEMMTSTETTVPHQPGFLAEGNSTSSPLAGTTAAAASPGLANTGESSTEAPSKLPHELSAPTTTTEASASTDKPPLILALGHDAATNAFFASPGATGSSPDFFNLVTSGEYSPPKMSVSNFGFPHGGSLAASKLISLQPRVQTLLNYTPSSLAVRDYAPTAHASYVQAFSAPLRRPFAQNEGVSYASYPGENSPTFLRQSSQLIDIGQGLGQGYGSHPQELPVNIGSWSSSDYGAQRGMNSQAKHVFGVAKLGGYTMPASSPFLSKIGFGPGSW